MVVDGRHDIVRWLANRAVLAVYGDIETELPAVKVSHNRKDVADNRIISRHDDYILMLCHR